MPRGANPNSRKNLRPNKRGPARITTAVREIARGMLEDADYQAKLVARLKAGRAGLMEPLLWHYGYGKPREDVRLETVPALVIDRLTRDDDA